MGADVFLLLFVLLAARGRRPARVILCLLALGAAGPGYAAVVAGGQAERTTVFQDHYLPLVVAYLVALGAWLAVSRFGPPLWPLEPVENFERPWREFGIALGGGMGILAVGQLWSSGVRLPEEGSAGALFAALNQMLIFAPMLLVPVIRRQSWATAWLPRGRMALRLLAGFLLSSLAVAVYSLLREGAGAPWLLLTRIWRFEHIDKMAQVLLEDLTVAILFVRLAAAVGDRWASAVVACLFAAGHIPAMVSQGVTWPELGGLLRDAGLGVAVILVLQRSRDVAWFWCIHFCLDMTQFAGVSGVR
jgi:hypothetical protein